MYRNSLFMKMSFETVYLTETKYRRGKVYLTFCICSKVHFTRSALNIFYCHTVNHFVSTFCLLCCTDFWTPRKLININAFINDKSSKISIKIPKPILLTKLSITTEIGREKDAYLFRLIGDNSTIATLFPAC